MRATVDLTTCPFLTTADIGELLRSSDLARRCIREGWIKPTSNTSPTGNGTNLYSRRDVDALIGRIYAGEVPPARKEAA